MDKKPIKDYTLFDVHNECKKLKGKCITGNCRFNDICYSFSFPIHWKSSQLYRTISCNN